MFFSCFFFNVTFNLMAQMTQIQLQFIKANYIRDQQGEKSAPENSCVITWHYSINIKIGSFCILKRGKVL